MITSFFQEGGVKEGKFHSLPFLYPPPWKMGRENIFFMSITEQIENDFKGTFKSKNEIELSALRMIKAALLNKKKETGQDVSESDVLSVLQSLVKRHKDSIASYEGANRPDLITVEQSQMSVVQRYLPEQLSEEEVRKAVEEVVDSLSLAEKKNFGVVMKASMQALKSHADGAMVSKVVKELVS
jgi:uncharacterized protein YqeY